jgi:hypothetical protein
MAVGIHHADHTTPFIRKMLRLTLPASGGRSVGIIRSRTQAKEFLYYQCIDPDLIAVKGKVVQIAS